MSRQVFLVFFGDARWGESAEAELANLQAHGVGAGATELRGGRRPRPGWPGCGTRRRSRRDPDVGPAPVTAETHADGVHPHESPWTMTSR